MAVASSTTLFCQTCGLKVKKKGFLVNKEIYCEVDYKRKFSPRCEECSDFIFGVSNLSPHNGKHGEIKYSTSKKSLSFVDCIFNVGLYQAWVRNVFPSIVLTLHPLFHVNNVWRETVYAQ